MWTFLVSKDINLQLLLLYIQFYNVKKPNFSSLWIYDISRVDWCQISWKQYEVEDWVERETDEERKEEIKLKEGWESKKEQKNKVWI